VRHKLLIIGPIGYKGGRAIEVNMLATGFSKYFDVEVFSLTKLDPNPQHKKSSIISTSSLLKLVLAKSLLFKTLTWLAYVLNKRKGDFVDYLGNSIAKKRFALDRFKKKTIQEKLIETDIIFICADLSSTFLKDIIEFGNTHNKKVFFRTTGTIKDLTLEQETFLKKVTLYIHHSQSNANRLSSYFTHTYEIIDQAAHNEVHLIKLPQQEVKPKIFGYLGRLSPEKGIDTLLQAITVLHKKCQFVIAGDGPLSDKVKTFAQQNNTVEVVGWVDGLSLKGFFEKIDCLIIPSLEESGPLVAIEALCASRLLITTRVGAMEERLKPISKTFFFNTGDSEGLVQKILEVQNLKKEEVSQISLEYRDLYEQKFSKTNVLERYIDVVKKEINSL